MDTHRILLVEDDAALRARLVQLIKDSPDFHLVEARGDVAGGRRVIEAQRPDLALVDLGLPDGSGLELIRAAKGCGTLALVLTTFGDESNVFEALRAGARGYLVKDAPGFEICEALRQAVTGNVPISPTIAGYLLERSMQVPRASRAPGAREDALTRMEGRVLELLACGYTYQECASMLKLSQNTISSHVRNIYGKLGANSCSGAIYRAVSAGYLRWGVDGPVATG